MFGVTKPPRMVVHRQVLCEYNVRNTLITSSRRCVVSNCTCASIISCMCSIISPSLTNLLPIWHHTVVHYLTGVRDLNPHTKCNGLHYYYNNRVSYFNSATVIFCRSSESGHGTWPPYTACHDLYHYTHLLSNQTATHTAPLQSLYCTHRQLFSGNTASQHCTKSWHIPARWWCGMTELHCANLM